MQSQNIAATLYNILKIIIFILLLAVILFVLIKIYTPEGIVVLPFDISNNEKINGIAIADQLTAELMRIQQIHNIKFGGNNFQGKSHLLYTKIIYGKIAW
jgi:hypothetical protein